MQSHAVDVVLDIGAGCGSYGSELRRTGYAGRIVSFEPLRAPFARLDATTRSDPDWDAHQFALGDTARTVSINVAANNGGSSSFLPMLDAHLSAAPWAAYIGTEEVALRTLDALAPEILKSGDRVFLKADVQGYEHLVLAGATSTLSRCVGLQLEMSLVPLYQGAMLYRDVIAVAGDLGFTLMEVIPVFHDVRTGRLLQMDGVFFREGEMPFG